jgi:hypothetical protein
VLLQVLDSKEPRFVKSSFHWSSLHSLGSSKRSRDRNETATPETNAWVWTYAVIMREEGEIIGRVDEGFLRVFSAGWGGWRLVGVLTCGFRLFGRDAVLGRLGVYGD